MLECYVGDEESSNDLTQQSSSIFDVNDGGHHSDVREPRVKVSWEREMRSIDEILLGEGARQGYGA